jgi:hypothetical protein
MLLIFLRPQERYVRDGYQRGMGEVNRSQGRPLLIDPLWKQDGLEKRVSNRQSVAARVSRDNEPASAR